MGDFRGGINLLEKEGKSEGRRRERGRRSKA